MTYTRQSFWTSEGHTSGAAIQAWLESRAPSGARYVKLPQVPIPDGFGQIIVEEARNMAINHDLLAAQIAHESAACQSRIARDKNNYTGYGAINSSPYESAHTFATPRDGVRVTVAHLRGYISGDGPWNELSPRYALVKAAGNAGVVDTLADLEQRWAWSPPAQYNATPINQRYGAKLADLANDLLRFAEGYEEETTVTQPIISGLIDIRGKLQTATEGSRGPLKTISMARKRGVVVHYRGVVTTPAAGYDSFAADATYHVNRNWATSGPPIYGDGIMYHVGIGWDGEAYWMRDFDRVVWHCGVTKQNEEALAIQLPMGGQQKATPAMLETLERVVDEWRSATNTPRNEVWGHRELSATTCPGTLMADFVTPYRAGGTVKPPPPAFDLSASRDPWNSPHGDFWVLDRFIADINRHDWHVTGYALSGAFAEGGLIVQYFERARLELSVDGKVTRGLVGQEAYYINHQRAAA